MLIKKITTAIFISLFFLVANSQEVSTPEFKPNGKPLATIYSYFRYDMSQGVKQKSKFDIYRAYLGYKYNFSENISAKIVLDVGEGGASSYSAYLKNAQLDWQMHKRIKFTFGMMGLTQHKHQEKFYGYRYILKTIQDDKGLSTSAALGANFQFSILKNLNLDVFMLNANGYKKGQDTFGTQRYGACVSTKLYEKLSLKAYYNFMPGKEDVYGNDSIFIDILGSNISTFIGYKFSSKFRIGAEYNLMLNAKKYSTAAGNYTLSGISTFSTYTLTKKWEVFGRFDYLASNVFEATKEAWNKEVDGSLYMFGLQYSPLKGVKTALNYRFYDYHDNLIPPNSTIYLNFEYKF